MSLASRLLADSRSLLRLSGPIVLSQVAYVLMSFVDMVMAGQAGAFEQAVVSLGGALWIPLFIAGMFVVQAISPVVAHHFGAGDHRAVADDTREGIWLALGISVLPYAFLPFGPALLVMAGVEPALAQRTGVFLWGIALGLPAAMVFRALAFFSASINRVRPMMVLAFMALGINALLNAALIHGRWGFPRLGGAGCGWATGVGMWCSLIGMVLWTAFAPAYRAYPLWHAWRRPTWAAQKRLLRLGLPMGAAGLAEVSAFAGVAVLVGRFGPVQIAAHQVALNFASLLYMLPMGLSSAMAIRVGQALGAQQPVRARQWSWTGLGLGLAIGAVTILPMVFGRHWVAAAYSSDDAVRALAANLLLFAACWQLFDAAQTCAVGALRGYKVTLPPMVLMIVAFWCVGIPLGTWLGYRGWNGRPMEVYGFWIGLLVGLALVALGLVGALRRVSRTE